MSFEAEGKKAARVALHIMAGKQIEGMAVPDAGENAYMFDWRRRFPFADLSAFEKAPAISHLGDLFTLDLITCFVLGKLFAGRT
jgi:hypothetical protein